MNRFDGAIYRPTDEGYEAARCAAVWNGIKPTRFPAAIIVAASEQDVPRAVALALREDLSIGVRSGGHNWWGNAIRDGGLLLDLSRLDTIEIDAEARIATVEPGVKSGALAAALAAQGLFFPTGHCPSVGLGGYLLGGGWGINAVKVGPACYSVRAIDVVTAEGEMLHVTDNDYPELMWAARGSGSGFFAIATRFHLDVYPQPPVMVSTMQTHPLSAYEELVPWFLETAPIVLGSGAMTSLVAYRDPSPDADVTSLMVVGYSLGDSFDAAAGALAPLASAPSLNRAIFDVPPRQTSLEELLTVYDQMYPEGKRYLADNVYLADQNSPQLWRDAEPVFTSLPSPRSSIWLLPGISWDAHPNAALNPWDQMNFGIFAAYEDETEDDEMRAWHANAIGRIEPHSLGAGYIGDANLPVRPIAVLLPEHAVRLEELRDKYDPQRRLYSYPQELPLARI